MNLLKYATAFFLMILTPSVISTPKSDVPVKKDSTASIQKSVEQTKSNPTLDDVIKINVKERETIIDASGQALSQFPYEVINKGSKPIKSIQWLSIYTHNREVIYSQDMQLELDSPLPPNQMIPINLQIPFGKIDEKFRPIFLNTKETIKIYKIARIIEYSDNKIISKE